MYKELLSVNTIEEIEEVLFKNTDDFYFIGRELKSVEHKNTLKSLGARYMIKKSILDFLGLNDKFNDIEIENEQDGKPVLKFSDKLLTELANKQVNRVHASIAHSRNFITTLVVLE